MTLTVAVCEVEAGNGLQPASQSQARSTVIDRKRLKSSLLEIAIMNRPSDIDIQRLYNQFDSPVVGLDCGRMCAPYNPHNKPFCCDICEAVPAVYYQEWKYLRRETNLWHPWRGDECNVNPEDPAPLQAEIPENMLLLACLGPRSCQREYRAVSCRQFPFFPYIASDGRFLGLAYYWEFEDTCWVVSNLDQVLADYRREFVQAYDEIFSYWPDELGSYASLSEQMRSFYIGERRRATILHRNGGCYQLSPYSERLKLAKIDRLPRFGFYKKEK
jgi:hypothetical protein